MKIVFLTSEAVPFAKTGGLADVSGALPIELAALGHDVAVVMPRFAAVDNAAIPIATSDGALGVAIEDQTLSARISHARLPNSEVPVYFIDQPQLFDRPGLYGEGGHDYPDNCLRFAFYCRAALSLISRYFPNVDVVHCNDWQSALVPMYIAKRFSQHSWMPGAMSVMTIHNMAYQGIFPKQDLFKTGFGWEEFHVNALEYYDQLNFLKAGILFADAITTVSNRYAEEIQTTEHGCGLDGILRDRREVVCGIPNGIDTHDWNPALDPHLVQRYEEADWAAGKSANRAALQADFNLPVDAGAPVIGLIGRLAEQKGWDLVLEAMRRFLRSDSPAQWVVLGTGDMRYQEALSALADQHPERLGLHLGFSNQLAHRIEAGSDLFLMPSRYEPCGLNQLYSLRYGTVPIVNPTGGLADTVVDTTAETLAAGTATGFWLPHYSPDGLCEAVARALQMQREEPETWAQLAIRGMRQDWSWGRSAIQYIELYEQTIARKRNFANPSETEVPKRPKNRTIDQ